jgi:hypothetical protein
MCEFVFTYVAAATRVNLDHRIERNLVPIATHHQFASPHARDLSSIIKVHPSTTYQSSRVVVVHSLVLVFLFTVQYNLMFRSLIMDSIKAAPRHDAVPCSLLHESERRGRRVLDC